jgi:hypothetical protein
MLRPFARCIAVAGLVAAMLPATPLSAADDALSQSIDLYQQRYQVTVGGQPDKSNPYEKIVQDHGQGPATLYGLRNLRAVLPGVVYRSGANNAFRDLYKEKPRNGVNPLPPEGLTNLCQEGFSAAIYLYDDHYSTAKVSTACNIRPDVASAQPPNTLSYLDKLPLSKAGDAVVRDILQMVHAKLTGAADPRPMLVHCYNGWHASGITSALVLRQFCGVNGDDAVAYWNCNTDGVCSGKKDSKEAKSYNKIRARIRAFKAYDDLKITTEIRDKVCPKLANTCPHPPKNACPT